MKLLAKFILALSLFRSSKSQISWTEGVFIALQQQGANRPFEMRCDLLHYYSTKVGCQHHIGRVLILMSTRELNAKNCLCIILPRLGGHSNSRKMLMLHFPDL